MVLVSHPRTTLLMPAGMSRISISISISISTRQLTSSSPRRTMGQDMRAAPM